MKGEIRLPLKKLTRISQEVDKWCDRKAFSKQKLLSLIGLLQHAALVVVPGHPFLRHLTILSKPTKHLHYIWFISTSLLTPISYGGAPLRPLSTNIPHLRFFGAMGLWCVLGLTMVLTGRDRADALTYYYLYGAVAHSFGGCNVGSQMAVLPGDLPL